MKLKLRPATMKDAEFLLQLKNDPESLRWSWNHSPTGIDEHREWLEKALADEDQVVYVAMLGKRAIGTIRTKREWTRNEVSFTVAAEYRGKGYGTQMLKALPSELSPLVAYIDIGNGRSLGAFISAGFKLIVKAVKE